MTATSKHQQFRQNRLKQLRAFCYAAQAKSMSKAAERMHLSQPSISLQVRALERELDVVLFERKGPRIALTPDGQALYELATPLIEGMDNLSDAFAERRGDVASGVLNIAAGESTILYTLPPFVERFHSRYPGVSLRLHNVTGRDGMALLRADEVDFAVGSMLDFPEDISFQPIFNHETVLITAMDHPLAGRAEVTLEDISPHGLILPPRHLSTWRVVDLVFQQHNVPYAVALEAGGWEIIKKYVGLGLGVSIVSSICLTKKEDLAVKPLSRYFPSRAYGVVLRRGRFLSPAAKRFIRMMDPSFFASHAGPDPKPIVAARKA